MKIKFPADGLTKTLSKITVWLLPLVTLFPSGIVCANILTPGLVFEIVKLPKTIPVFISWDWTIAWLEETIVVTINSVLKVFAPFPAIITADPIMSPTFMFEILKDPTLDTNKDVDISGSFGSWLTLIVKLDKLSQSVFEIETETSGEKGIQGTSPVLPPTQFPQLSINAPPPKSLLQSKHKIFSEDVWTSTSESSEFIVEVKVITCAVAGLINKLLILIIWLFPLVTLLLSGKEDAITKTPPLKFSIVNVP